MGPSWYMSDPAVLNRGAPCLGEDNAYVLGDILVVRPVTRSEKAVDRGEDGSVQVADDGPRCFLVAGLGQSDGLWIELDQVSAGSDVWPRLWSRPAESSDKAFRYLSRSIQAPRADSGPKGAHDNPR